MHAPAGRPGQRICKRLDIIFLPPGVGLGNGRSSPTRPDGIHAMVPP